MKSILKLIVACLMSGLLLCLPALAVDVIIDGVKVEFTDSTGYPYISPEGRTLVPLRAAMEAFGASVRWDASNYAAIVTKNETTVVCKIGENCIYRNGTKIPNDASAVISNGRTYLPIRAVLEALDATVGWDGNVIVTSPGAGDLICRIEHHDTDIKNFWAAWVDALELESQGRCAECIEALKEVAPVYLAASDYNSDAMLYNHLGHCYEILGMNEEAEACYHRESEYWELAGLHQASLDAERRSSFSHSTVQMFVSSDNEKYSGRHNFGVKYAPENGVLFGVTLKQSDANYMDEFAANVGKEAAGFLLYGTVDTPVKIYNETFERAIEENKIVQYALQPRDVAELASIKQDDGRYIKIAKDLNKTGAKIFLRFACEMNDTSSPMYTENYDMYIEKFRFVSDIFRKYAPNCAIVWSPNFYPGDNIDYYYPGDEYLDYVGISAYAEYQPETDPMQLGIDRSRFAALLDNMCSLYSHKKPIIVSESGASYYHPRTGKDLTEFASERLYDFLTYLPIKYPQVYAMFLFETKDAGNRRFELKDNSTYRDAFIRGIASKDYLSFAEGEDAPGVFSYEIGNNVAVPAQKVKLHSFIKTFHNDFSYVVYRINGVDVGVSYGIPYTIDVDFTPYKGQTVTVTCLGFDSMQKICAQKSYNIKVE